jgi:hypothetical protein
LIQQLMAVRFMTTIIEAIALSGNGVKAGRTRSEQTTTGLPRQTDILELRRHVSKAPIAGKLQYSRDRRD